MNGTTLHVYEIFLILTENTNQHLETSTPHKNLTFFIWTYTWESQLVTDSFTIHVGY
jgi:hypothetical protein